MTKNQMEKNLSANTLMDKIMQGAALFGLLGLAYWKVLDYVPTSGTNMRYALAALPLVFALYLIISPIFRKA